MLSYHHKCFRCIYIIQHKLIKAKLQLLRDHLWHFSVSLFLWMRNRLLNLQVGTLNRLSDFQTHSVFFHLYENSRKSKVPAVFIGMTKNGLASHFCMNRATCETKITSSHEILIPVTCIFFQMIIFL